MLKLHTTETEFNQLQTLSEKLAYVRQLNKQADFEQALTLYLQLKDQFEQIQDHQSVMNCLSGICQSLGNLGRVYEIEQYLTAYKTYCYQYGDRLDKFKLNTFIGYISVSIEDYETAVEYYEAAISIASELEDIVKSTNVLVNLQSTYLELNKIDLAVRCSEQLHQLFKEDRNAFSPMCYTAYLLNYMTVVIETDELEKFPLLLEDLQQVEGYYKLKREQMYTAYLTGVYHEKLGELERATNYLEVAYEYLIETKEAPYYKRVVYKLSQLFKKRAMFQEALHYGELLYEYMDSLDRKKIQLKTLELSAELKVKDLQELIYFDSLTNIHNRRYLEIQGENWIKYAIGNNEPLICAIFDIDDFKQINDQFGHVVGDEVIHHISKQLRKYSEDNMICARYGGDEFVILARHKQDYLTVFQQLFSDLTKDPFVLNDQEIAIEISMGVSALHHAKQKTLKALIDVADKELYRMKDRGKNGILFSI